jgi:hypothetical protein
MMASGVTLPPRSANPFLLVMGHVVCATDLHGNFVPGGGRCSWFETSARRSSFAHPGVLVVKKTISVQKGVQGLGRSTRSAFRIDDSM